MLSQSEVFKILKAVREGKARRVEDVYALVAVENRDLDVMFSFFISYYQRKATTLPVTGITLDVYHFLVYLVQFSNYIEWFKYADIIATIIIGILVIKIGFDLLKIGRAHV